MQKCSAKDDLREDKLVESGVANERKDIGIKVLPLRTTKSPLSTGYTSFMEDPTKVRDYIIIYTMSYIEIDRQ